LADYVLSRFKGEELELIREALRDTTDACRMIITTGIDVAMNQYNKKKADKIQVKVKPGKNANKGNKVEDKPLENANNEHGNNEHDNDESINKDKLFNESKQTTFLGRLLRKKAIIEATDDIES
jgi:hypothetical protein